MNNKFETKSLSLPLVLKKQKDFINAFDNIVKRIVKAMNKPSINEANLARCLFTKGKLPILYAKVTDEINFYNDEGESAPVSDFIDLCISLEVTILIESVFVGTHGATLQVKVLKARVPEVKVKEEEEEEEESW